MTENEFYNEVRKQTDERLEKGLPYEQEINNLVAHIVSQNEEKAGLLEEKKKLTEEMLELKETLLHREHFIDWVIDKHPEIAIEYLGL